MGTAGGKSETVTQSKKSQSSWGLASTISNKRNTAFDLNFMLFPKKSFCISIKLIYSVITKHKYERNSWKKSFLQIQNIKFHNWVVIFFIYAWLNSILLINIPEYSYVNLCLYASA